MRHYPQPGPLLPLLLLGAAACGAGEGGGHTVGFAARDSAGVEILENGQPERALTLREVLRVGVADGDPAHQFESIRSITVEPGGGFWVVDRNEGVRRYEADGRYVRRLGARGQGPGESEMYYSVTVEGARALLSGVPGVLQLFDTAGTLLASADLNDTGGFRSPVGAADGAWIFLQRLYEGEGAVFRGGVAFFRAEGPTGPYRAIGTFPGELNRLMGSGHVGSASWFHGNPHFAVDGGGRIFATDTAAYRIEVHDPGEGLVRVVTRSVEPTPFDPAWLDAMEAGFETAQLELRGSGATVDRERLAQQMASATPDPVPAHLPFIEGLLVGPDGEMWVERADRHPSPPLRAVAHQYGYIRHAWPESWAAPRVFDLFTAKGRYRGTVEVPADFAPMAVAGERVWGVHYDDLDVERVVVWDVVEAGR